MPQIPENGCGVVQWGWVLPIPVPTFLRARCSCVYTYNSIAVVGVKTEGSLTLLGCQSSSRLKERPVSKKLMDHTYLSASYSVFSNHSF